MFKQIDGYPRYAACDDGYIVNVETGNVLKPHIHPRTGYANVWLHRDGEKQRTFTVHSLIARAFCHKEHDGQEVNHIDGNKLNNRADNLEWVDHSENLRHAYESGLMPNNTVPKKVVATNIETGEQMVFDSIYSASKFLNISKGNICMCCKGNRPYAGGFYWDYAEGE